MKWGVFVLSLLAVKFLFAQFPAEFNHKRGVFYNHAGDYEMAIELCNRAISDNPEYSPAYNTRGNAKFKKDDYLGALKDYSRAIELNKNDSLSFYNRAVTKVQINDYAGAERDFTKTIEIAPGFKDAYICRGIIRQRLNDFSGARDDFRRVDEITEKKAKTLKTIPYGINYEMMILD